MNLKTRRVEYHTTYGRAKNLQRNAPSNCDATMDQTSQTNEPVSPLRRDDRRVIALVDDDRNILTTVSIALQAEGFETRVYSDGETALRALSENPPDLAVFDIKMPRMDGMELLAKLRERSALPVIFLTSKDDERDEEAGFEMGADDYIAKPIDESDLLDTCERTLRKHQRLDASAP